jgi:hypothetical protein
LPVGSNDNQPAFETFMTGYWHQMADELYTDFDAGLSDFKQTEGEKKFRLLRMELIAMYRCGRFPPLSEIKAYYSDPFWKRFDCIITEDQVKMSKILFADDSDVR